METFIYLLGISVFGTGFVTLIRNGKDSNKLKIMSCRSNLRMIKRLDSNDSKNIF